MTCVYRGHGIIFSNKNHKDKIKSNTMKCIYRVLGIIFSIENNKDDIKSNTMKYIQMTCYYFTYLRCHPGTGALSLFQ